MNNLQLDPAVRAKVLGHVPTGDRDARETYRRRKEKYTAGNSPSVIKEEQRFLRDAAAVRNESIRRSNVLQEPSPVKTTEELYPAFLKLSVESEARPPQWGSSQTLGGETAKPKNVYMSLLGEKGNISELVVPVKDLNQQAQRREAQRLRNITAQLASAADSALNRMALLADEIPSAYPTTVVPYSKDGMQLEDRASVTPPQSPTGPGYTYPPRVRAPPRHMKVASATSLAAAQSNTTSGLVLASTALAGFQPQQQEQISKDKPKKTPFPGARRLEEMRPGMVQSQPSHPILAGQVSQVEEAAMLDSEVSRINRVAETLGLRPLGISKEEAAESLATEVLSESIPAGPMEAFREASKFYRHIFYQMFRHELANCHDRAEALAQLWFSIDKFLHQVCAVAEQEHQNAYHERCRGAQVEDSFKMVSSQLKSSLQDKERMHALLNVGQRSRRSHTPSSRGLTPVQGASRPGARFFGFSPSPGPGFALGNQQLTQEMSTCTTLDDHTDDVQKAMQDAVGYTRRSPYQFSHGDMVAKPLAAADAAASAAVQYGNRESMQFQPSSANAQILQGAVSIEHIGLQARIEQQRAEIERLKLAHLDLRQHNELLRSENRTLNETAQARIREAQESVTVIRQQLYRAQALLRSNILATLNGMRKHAADINNTLAFPNQPKLGGKESNVHFNVPLGHKAGNRRLFQGRAGDAKGSPGQSHAGDAMGMSQAEASKMTASSYMTRGGPRVLSDRSSYNPDTAGHTKIQYDTKDILDEAMDHIDRAVVEATLYPDLNMNPHRNHVRQIVSAAGEATLTHGMDLFCDFFMKVLDAAVAKEAEAGTGLLVDNAGDTSTGFPSRDGIPSGAEHQGGA